MIDIIHRQHLDDQIETARALLDEIVAYARCMEIMARRPEHQAAAILSGAEVSRLAIELSELAPDLCDTAARFDLGALEESGVSR